MLFQESGASPLGRIVLAAEVENGTGVSPRRLRVYGRFGLMLVTGGHGSYRDGNGVSVPLVENDLVIVFPDWPHWYGPHRGETWSEIHVVFEGPIFDLWRKVGMISPTNAVRSLPSSPSARGLLRSVFAENDVSAIRRVHSFVGVLTEFVGELQQSTMTPTWIREACRLLSTDLHCERSSEQVAESLGIGHELFRKRFTEQVGIPPAKFRRDRRLQSGKELLVHTSFTLRQVANHLGFADEFTFSKRFKAEFGVSPREYRNEPDSLPASI